MTGLDYGYQVRLLQHLVDLAGSGHTTLFSTHNPEHAVRVAIRIAQQGRLAFERCSSATGLLQEEP